MSASPRCAATTERPLPTPPRRWSTSRTLRWSLAAAVAVAALGACAPAPGDDAPEGWRRATITQEQSDVLRISSDAADAARIEAPSSNVGTNSRALLWRDDAPVTRDHGVCATASHSGGPNQEGVALRVARSPHGGVRGITVNKNTWVRAHWFYNVMLWDTSQGDHQGFGIRTAVQYTGIDMRTALSGSAAGDTPRRLCARLSGTTLEWKLWPTNVAEPSWDDPAHTARVVLPQSWVYQGSPGLYIGHTPPGGWATFGAVTLDAPDALGASSGGTEQGSPIRP